MHFWSEENLPDNRHLQLQLEVKLESFQKYKAFGQDSIKTNLFVLEREYCAHDTWICNEDIDSHFAGRLKNLCADTMCTGTHSIRTTQDPNMFNNANMLPTVRGERATHPNCSQ